jgi:phage tail sheath protein FI
LAILDCPEDVPDPEQLKQTAVPRRKADTAGTGAGGERGGGLRAPSCERGHAAYYYPWIVCVNALDPSPENLVSTPPSGHIAGIYARTDRMRGVHKAPANAEVRGALNVVYNVTDAEQGALNAASVNVIRFFSGGRPVIWGARTLAESSSEWKYINVRRTMMMLGKSIGTGTKWAVFEPNDMFLWSRIRCTIGAFLTRIHGSGALLGRTAGESFFVKCDEETNPPEVIDAGQVVAIIGVAIVKPAEFVIFRIGQNAASTELGEGAHG